MKANSFDEIFHSSKTQLESWRPTEQSPNFRANVIDFFCGCGGMSLGFAVCNHGFFRILGGVDINKVALKAFSSNFNTPSLCKDIREIYENDTIDDVASLFSLQKDDPKPLIIIGCAPCQGFSAHRKKDEKKKKEDSRNTLIGVFADIALKLEPDFIVMENVPEIITGKYKEHYKEAQKIFKQKGYYVTQKIYNAAGFGVPQARRRAIIVASRCQFSLPDEILDRDNYVTVRDAIGDLPPVEAGELCPTDKFHVSTKHKQSTIETILQVPHDGGNRPKGIGPKCLDKVKGFSDVYGRLFWDKPSITITQTARNPACGRFVHPEQNRALTIREAARIQSFPDGFIFEGSLDSCFSQIGEAVPPLLSLAIASKISETIENIE